MLDTLRTSFQLEGVDLSPDEVELCQKAFNQYDKDKSGTIDVKELRTVLSQMNMFPSDDELFVLVNSFDDDGSGEIDFPEFLQLVMAQKKMAKEVNDESDTIEAFVALGGQRDLSGKVQIAKLQAVVDEFELAVSISELVKDVDKDNSGEVTFDEFKQMLAKV
eukprot:TRINITY_DN10396_c0_g1_i2.p1 TRINITY_DN10396_c0_g1~~TRINITY_DN10396_c0_g1_i2.p1  ORF type:complete len:163 (-),score=32.11 TRINITY_DN10396_c0_g1_i2:152-640(-)